MPSYEELVAKAAPNKRRLDAADRPRLAVCVDTSSIAVGAIETLVALQQVVRAGNIDADVDRAGGNGMSFANPVVELSKPDGTRVYYQRVTSADAAEFAEISPRPGRAE